MEYNPLRNIRHVKLDLKAALDLFSQIKCKMISECETPYHTNIFSVQPLQIWPVR